MTGVFVPAGTPKEIVTLLQKEIAAVVKSPDIKARLAASRPCEPAPDGLRLQVIQALSQGERCVCELTDELDLAQSRLSFHLRVLREAGLIQARLVHLPAFARSLAVDLIGAEVSATAFVHRIDLRAPMAWVFGAEGAGLSAAMQAVLTRRVAIAQTDAVESLNVAAAAAVCLFEMRRQRLG